MDKATHRSFKIVRLNCQSFTPFQPTKRFQYHCIFLSNGSLERLSEKVWTTIHKNQIALIRPNEDLSLYSFVNAAGFALSFDIEFLESIILLSPYLQQLQIDIDNIVEIPLIEHEHYFLTEILEQLESEYSIDQSVDKPIIRSLFRVFILYLSRVVKSMKSPVEQDQIRFIRQFYLLLDRNFTTLKTPSGYAQLMSVRLTFLNKQIKRKLGCTASHLIQQRIITESKRLILYDHCRLKEVASKLGFCDVSHFAKFFKANSGQTVGDFRRTFVA